MAWWTGLMLTGPVDNSVTVDILPLQARFRKELIESYFPYELEKLQDNINNHGYMHGTKASNVILIVCTYVCMYICTHAEVFY